MKTVSHLPFNLSPKALMAFLFPFLSTLVGVGVTWIVTGAFDGQEVREGAAGLLASGLALAGAYVAPPAQTAPAGTVAVPDGKPEARDAASRVLGAPERPDLEVPAGSVPVERRGGGR
jgi:hypothetical protein